MINMKFVITIKDPDAIDFSLSGKQPEAEKAKARQVLSMYAESGEYFYIEVDTDNKTAKLLEAP